MSSSMKTINQIDTIYCDSIKPAICSSIYDLFHTAAKSENIVLHTSSDVNWIKSDSSRWPNVIFDAHFDRKTLKKRVNQVTEQIISGNAPSMWLVEQMESSRMLSNCLENSGYIINEEWCGMAIELNSLNKKHASPNNFSIHSVTDTRMLQDWLDITSSVFFNGQKLSEDIFSDLASNSNISLFLGICDNSPVATSLLHFSCGAAGIYFVSVSPEYLNRGFGKAITAAPLIEAQNSGYSVGLLQATPMGERIYNKIGFKKFSKFNLYELQY